MNGNMHKRLAFNILSVAALKSAVDIFELDWVSCAVGVIAATIAIAVTILVFGD